MKPGTKQKWIHFGLLAAAVIVVVEFQKFQQRRAPACEDGVCRVPAEYAAAKVTGPQTVPFMPPAPKNEGPRPKLMDFGAGQCATCKMMDVVLDELTQATDGKLIVQYIDTKEKADLVEQYKVRMIPTQIFLDAQGNELFRHEGFISKEDILKKWNSLGITL